MNSQCKIYMDFEQKNKSVLSVLWYSIFLVTLVELLNGILYQLLPFETRLEHYYLHYLIIPFACNASIGLLTTLLFKKFNHNYTAVTSYIVIIGFVVFVAVDVMIHYGIGVIYMGYVIPIFLSILFNNKHLTIVVASLCTIHYLFVYFFYLPMMPSDMYKHDFMDFAATFGFITATFIIGMYIMNAFNELIEKIVATTSLKRHLEKEIRLDSFTKLYNRACFDEMLQNFASDYKTAKVPFTLLIFDIDNFKNVNDTFGHDFGDAVILSLVDIIKANIRETDLAFRYGGEEFAVILRADRELATHIAEKIRIAFHKVTYAEHPHERFSVSGGLCESTNQICSATEIFSKSDKALYKAKREGKNKVMLME